MRALKNKINVQSPDGDYPFARAKDNTGGNNGTPVDEKLLGDLLQFAEKLMFEGAVVPNEFPDNEYAGFQLFEALLKNIHHPLQNVLYQGIYEAHPNTPIKLRKIGSSLVQIQGCLYASAAMSLTADTVIFLIGATLVPPGTLFWATAYDFINQRDIPLQIIPGAGEVRLRGDISGFDSRGVFINITYRTDS